MKRVVTALGFALLLQACGGGGGGGNPPPVAAPPPPPPAQLSLDASNYQGALSNALEAANAAFAFAKLGADVADHLFGAPLVFPRAFPCQVSGTGSLELTDRNRNTAFEVNDSLRISMDACNSSANPLSGVVRIEIVSAVPIANGREYQFVVEINDLVIASVSGAAPLTINFAGTVFLTRATDVDHYVLTFGDFESLRSGQTKVATDLIVDYLQRYDTLSYEYLVQGTVAGVGAQGQYRVATPIALTGAIGSFPSAGRLTLSGGANSSAQLSEEGAAAANGATVLVSVDANGDGAADSAAPEFQWTTLLPLEIFTSLRDQAHVTALPTP